jgi:hypothetical protein
MCAMLSAIEGQHPCPFDIDTRTLKHPDLHRDITVMDTLFRSGAGLDLNEIPAVSQTNI